MRIIPVLDVLSGVVVRAVGGRRAEYRPVQSKLTPSATPLTVAKALIEATNASEVYVADLDAIIGGVGTGVGGELADAVPDTKIWLDQGVRTADDLARLPLSKPGGWRTMFKPLPRPNVVPVLGSETLAGPDVLASAATSIGSGCVFSVDTYDGQLLGDWQAWKGWGVHDASDLEALVRATQVLLGTKVVILLDLAHVGSRSGACMAKAVGRLKSAVPDLFFVTGGGVRTHDDVKALADAGADAVLVASALHDGTLTV